MTRPTDLYRHFDADGMLLYVGISLSAVSRLSAHKVGSEWFSKIARIEIETFETRESARDAERDAIATEKPRYNIQHKHCNSKKLKKEPSDSTAISEHIRTSGFYVGHIAKVVGVDPATIWRWRTGRSIPSDADQVKRMAELLRCPESDLTTAAT